MVLIINLQFYGMVKSMSGSEKATNIATSMLDMVQEYLLCVTLFLRALWVDPESTTMENITVKMNYVPLEGIMKPCLCQCALLEVTLE